MNFTCKVCKKVFYKKYRMKAHMKKHRPPPAHPGIDGKHPVPIFNCDVCKKELNKKNKLKAHRKKHRSKGREIILKPAVYICDAFEGNSDRRCAPPVKENAKKITKRSPDMRPWKENGQSSPVTTMADGDYLTSEQSYIMPAAGSIKITFHQADGTAKVLKEGLALQAGEVIDATKMDTDAFCAFFEQEIQDCYDKKLMMSLHMKATMMKVFDPIIFGHCFKVFFKDVFAKHGDLFAKLKINVNNGLGDIYEKIKGNPKQAEVEANIMKQYETRPGLAMVDSNARIMNLHVPSDVIIDASMPNVVRDSGQLWNKDDKMEEVKCVIPDKCYSTMDSHANERFDSSSTGHLSIVGLMAQKSEACESHDKTFEIPAKGTVVVTDNVGTTIFSHNVESGYIWRMCQTKDLTIQDWVKLAVSRAKDSGTKAIFWLNPARASDANLITLANKYQKKFILMITLIPV